mgnify:CR=1 FL=1
MKYYYPLLYIFSKMGNPSQKIYHDLSKPHFYSIQCASQVYKKHINRLTISIILE